jgi:UDP-glucuronate 4-epimerase
MALFIFTKAILEGRPIRLFNHGRMRRDFTYVDDVVAAMERLLDRPPGGDPDWSGDDPDASSSSAPWRLYNIGNNRSVELTDVVDLLERALGRKAIKKLVDMQPGDVPETCADIDDLTRDVGFRPSTPIEEGIRRFVSWYREFY